MVLWDGINTGTIQIDKAGRVVLPKPLREQFSLQAGDKLRLWVEGNSIKLEPADTGGKLVRKGSVLVFVGDFAEPVTTAMVRNLLSGQREAGLSNAAGKLHKFNVRHFEQLGRPLRAAVSAP